MPVLMDNAGAGLLGRMSKHSVFVQDRAAPAQVDLNEKGRRETVGRLTLSGLGRSGPAPTALCS